MERVHRDRRSILMLDRPAHRWRAGSAKGWAWSESLHPPPASPTGWRDIARANCCGLVADADRRFFHSSVSGIAPVVYARHDGATYFASSIDALVGALPGPFSPDWRAWAGTLANGYPIGRLTPFREVKRLREESLHERGRTVAEGEDGDWGWLEVPADLEIEAGAAGLVDALRHALSPLAGKPVTSLLSSGLDSRVMLCALRDVGADITALTIAADRGGVRDQQDMAAGIAHALGVSHEIHFHDPASYWDVWLERLTASDFQRAFFNFTTSLGPRLSELGGPFVDGLALDSLLVRGDRFYSRPMLFRPGSKATMDELTTRLRRYTEGLTELTLAPAQAAATLRSATDQALTASRRVRHGPSGVLLAFYSTRTRRGISLMPHRVLGRHAFPLTPATEDAVARATLRMSPITKRGPEPYMSVLRTLDRRAADYVSDRSGHPNAGIEPVRPAERLDPGFLRRLRGAALDGPMERCIGRRLRSALSDDATFAARAGEFDIHLATQNIAAFNLWHHRYADKLGDVDPHAGLASLSG